MATTGEPGDLAEAAAEPLAVAAAIRAHGSILPEDLALVVSALVSVLL